MRKLEWKDTIDIVGLVAILVGLFFVYRELDLNASIARAQLSAETAGNLLALDQMLMTDDLATAYVKSLSAPESLSEIERMKVNIFLSNILDQYARECYYESIGIFKECESYPRGTALKYFGSRYGRAFWQVVRNRMVGPRITAVIDETLAAVPADDIYLQLDSAVQDNLSNP